MRRWIPVLLALSALSGAPHAGAPPVFFGIPRDCPGDIDEGLRAALGDLRLECAAKVQVYGEHVQLNTERVQALGLDSVSQVRALVTGDEPAQATIYSGAISDAGSDGGMIWWGTWNAGAGSHHDGNGTVVDGASGMPMLYVSGIPASIVFREDALAARGAYRNGPMLVAGVADYRLLGASKLYSSYIRRDRGPAGLDSDGNSIAPATVTAASLRIDFAARRGVLEISYNLRGAPARQRIELKQRRAPSTRFEADEDGCAAAAEHCPTVELEFYGRQGEYAGVVLAVNTQMSMDEGSRVATRLREVRSHSVLAFKRQ